MMQPQWTVEAEGDAAPVTVTMQVARITVATETVTRSCWSQNRWPRSCTAWTASTTT
ncbi:MAG: hypothetical protein WCF33_05520 [Pseudonocardiaceae bacterium]